MWMCVMIWHKACWSGEWGLPCIIFLWVIHVRVTYFSCGSHIWVEHIFLVVHMIRMRVTYIGTFHHPKLPIRLVIWHSKRVHLTKQLATRFNFRCIQIETNVFVPKKILKGLPCLVWNTTILKAMQYGCNGNRGRLGRNKGIRTNAKFSEESWKF